MLHCFCLMASAKARAPKNEQAVMTAKSCSYSELSKYIKFSHCSSSQTSFPVECSAKQFLIFFLLVLILKVYAESLTPSVVYARISWEKDSEVSEDICLFHWAYRFRVFLFYIIHTCTLPKIDFSSLHFLRILEHWNF